MIAPRVTAQALPRSPFTAGAAPVFAPRHRRLQTLFARLWSAWGPRDWWPGDTPFEVVVGAVLTQNTNWSNVKLAMAQLDESGLLADPAALASVRLPRLERLVRSSGYFRQKAARLRGVARWYADAGGAPALRRRPLAKLRPELLALHGVGPETADSILCYALGFPVFVVDAYTWRVFERHALVEPGLDYEALRAWTEARLVPDAFNEAHALLVAAGSRHCKPRPVCEGCPARRCLPRNGPRT